MITMISIGFGGNGPWMCRHGWRTTFLDPGDDHEFVPRWY
jgi:hypothetical protein